MCACACVCVLLYTRPYSDLLRIVDIRLSTKTAMSTRVMAAPVSLDVRMLLPVQQQQQQRSSRPRIVPSPVCVSRVRRCLFGLPSDPQQAIQQAAQELQRQARVDSQRWNFDFVSEKPLPGGQYVWRSAAHDGQADDAANGNNNNSSADNSRMRQSQITEFLQSRKRTSSGTLTAAANTKRPCIRSSTTTTTTPADATSSRT